jgi:hypothetical protein
MGLLGALFGGSKSKSESGNSAFGTLNSALAPNLATSNNVFNDLAGQLSGGFDAFKKNAGFDFLLNKGMRDRVGGAASRGLMNSGSTLKSLAEYETGLGNTMYNNYLDKMGSVVNMGNQQAGILAGAGQWSKGSGSSNGGILSSLFG